MYGFINVYKEAGMTSHDVVNRIRKICNTKKVGHTGTLDPNATGVLPVAVGSATKVIEYMEADDKTYLAELTLGIVTDTEDIWGKVLQNKSNFNFSMENVIEVIKSFKGKQRQIPPMYSAIKINGKKLYELAREGKTVDREARDIEIFEIDIISFDENRVFFKVHCSKGTYIRTLCKDIGEKLGCGAVMSKLERVRSGSFNIDTAVKLSEIEENPEKFLIDLETPLKKFEIIRLNEEDERRYINGIRLKADKPDGRYRVYIGEKLYGICNLKEGEIKSEKRI